MQKFLSEKQVHAFLVERFTVMIALAWIVPLPIFSNLLELSAKGCELNREGFDFG